MSRSLRKGFTLVELLIVIVVIGVLSAMMMLSSTEAVSSARASNIINNLTNLKKATLAWYADNLDKLKLQKDSNNGNYWLVDLGSGPKRIQFAIIKDNKSEAFTQYLNGEGVVTLGSTSTNDPIPTGGYGLSDNGGANRYNAWYVGYKFAKGEDSVKEKLKSRASSLGLIFTSNQPQDGGEEKVVFMKVLDFN